MKILKNLHKKEENMQNLIKTEHDNLRIFSLIFLNIYFLGTVYERHAQFSFLSSIAIYAFLGVSMLYIINKKSVVGISNAQFTTRFLLCIMVEISLTWIDVSFAAGYAHRFFTSVVIAFVVGNLVYTEKDIKIIMFGYCVAGAFLSLNFFITYGSEIFTLAQKAEAAGRMGLEYGNLNEVAQRCLFAFIICSYYAFLDKGIGKWRIPAILNAVVCFLVILFTGSKKALIVGVVAIAVMFWQYSKTKSPATRIKYIVIGVLLIFAMIMIVINIPLFSDYKERFIVLFETLSGNVTKKSTSDLNRIKLITRGLERFTEKIMFGGGICYAAKIFGAYAHNNYVEMLVNFGITGFVIYYWGYVTNFVNLFKLKGEENLNAKTLFLVIMCAIVVIDIGVVTYYDRYICIMLSTINAYFTNKVSYREKLLRENSAGYFEKSEKNM